MRLPALAIAAVLLVSCGAAQDADEPTPKGKKKKKKDIPWPPPGLGMIQGPTPPQGHGGGGGGAPAPEPGGPEAPPGGPGGPPPGGEGGAGGPGGAISDGPFAGCNPAQQGTVILIDCPWGIAVTGRPAEKVARDKMIETLMKAILQGAQVKLDIGKSTSVTLSGKPYKGKKLSIKQPDPPHELVAEGVALFTSEKDDAHVIACLKAKQDSEAERCPKVLAELLAIPPP